VQDELGWLSPAALQAVADYLSLPLVAVHEVAHFYSMFCTRPVGRHTIRVCTSMPCEMAGGNIALRYLQEKLGVAVGETTKDGRFTLFAGTCMGSCGEGPVLLVNNKRMCVRMSNDRIDALLEELQ
jgi:NADH-quinone oxidoreductase subunit E